MPHKIEISHRTIIFTLLLILLAWLLFQISGIIVMIFISFILASAINPVVDKLESAHLPRSLAIVLVYLVLWGAVGGMIASVVPSLVDQTGRLIRMLPQALNQIELFTNYQQEIGQQLLTRIGTLPENLLKLTVGLFGNLLDVLTTLVMTFYLLLYHRHLNKYLISLVGSQNQPHVSQVVSQIESRLGSWVRGELILMVVVGLLTYIGLVLLGIDIALPLAILAGILEIVPNIGPIISAVPSVLVALTVHPFIAIATAALYFIVQFLENHLLVPKIMQRAVGVNPLVSIVVLMSGFRLAGPLGAIMALPVIIISHSVILELLSHKKTHNSQLLD